MKKQFFIITLIFLVIIMMISVKLINFQTNRNRIKKENAQYEYFLDNEIYGADLATLINKTIEKNEKNNINKDKDNYYIENDENSIKIYINMKTIENTYTMEEFYNNDIKEFVKNFSIIKFKCIDIEYHKTTEKVKSLTFEEILE